MKTIQVCRGVQAEETCGGTGAFIFFVGPPAFLPSVFMPFSLTKFPVRMKGNY
jgi:hypothetical protein